MTMLMHDPNPPAGTSADELFRLVRKRISWDLNYSNDDRLTVYHPLIERQHRLAMGVDMRNIPRVTRESLQALHDEFEVDLRAMLATDVESLRRMVMHGATRVGGISACDERAAAIQGMAAMTNARNLPRVQPSEVVQRFAARGVIVQALDGNLHVTPADVLTEADLGVLREHKAALLAVLARPAAVV